MSSPEPLKHALNFPELPRTRQKTIFMRDIRTMLALVHHGETLAALKLFAQPMDRAEVLHTPRYDTSGSWKNTPGENELVLSFEISTCPKIFNYICPGLLAAGGKPSTWFPPEGLVKQIGTMQRGLNQTRLPTKRGH